MKPRDEGAAQGDGGERLDRAPNREELRYRAEQMLEESRANLPPVEFASVSRMVHELQVYQAELEIQNEDLRRAQEALERSSLRHRDLFDFAPVGYFSLDASGAIVEANLAGSELLGVERRFLTRKPFLVFLPPEHHEAFLLHRKSVLATSCRQTCELELLRRDGQRRDVRLDGSVLVGEEGVATYFMAVIDLTDQRRAEEERAELENRLRQAQKMEAVGTLAGGIAHDFNNILTPIMALGELALFRLPDESPLRDDMTQLVAATERAAGLVRQILAFSRPDRDETPRPLDLAELVAGMGKLLRASLPPTITIRTSVTPSCGMVRGRLGQVHQMLLNLCTNARDAMAENGGVLEISLQPSTEAHPSGSWVSLSVTDTGVGIPVATLNRVFEPYFTTKSTGTGTGLGLAIVHGIVSDMGGRILARSTPGRGTTFEVQLPECAPAEAPRASASDAVHRGRGEHVLVADDEESIVTALRRMLPALGYRVTACASAAAALEVLRSGKERFDVVLTDLTMPGMSGLELAAEVGRIHPGLPVLLGTGHPQGMDAGALARHGLAGLLPKPYTHQTIGAALRGALDAGGIPRPAAG